MAKRVGWIAVMGVLAAASVAARPAVAQTGGHGYGQVISANPFGLLLEFFNAEYERGLTESSTIGIGGSFGQGESENDLGETIESTYFNGDIFARFYPGGSRFEGWNFGVKVGATKLDSGTYPGLGFDANRSWLLAKNNNFYVGLGFGLKRLFGDLPEEELEIVPTIRIVNVGFAF